MGWLLTGGRGGIQRRLRGAVRGRQALEQLSFLRTEAAETFDPQALMQAAMFRQRGIRGRDVGEAQFFSAQLERGMMQQENIGPRLQRIMGRGIGGFGALGGGLIGGLTALTGGLGLPLMALLGLGGMGLGAIAPGQVRARQMREVFGEFQGSPEQFLGVRGRGKADVPRGVIDKIKTLIGEEPGEEWFRNPANQVVIASLMQTPDTEVFAGGTFAGQATAGVAPGKSMGDLYTLLDTGELKAPLPVAIAGLDPAVALALGGSDAGAGQLTRFKAVRMTGTGPPGDRTSGFRMGDTRTARERALDRWGEASEEMEEATTPTGRDRYRARRERMKKREILHRNVAFELAEVEEKKEKEAKTKREEIALKLSQQSVKFQEQMAGYLKSVKKNLSLKEKDGFLSKMLGTLGGVFGPIMGALPLLLGGAGLSLISYATGGKIGTKAALTLGGKGLAKAAPGLAKGGALAMKGGQIAMKAGQSVIGNLAAKQIGSKVAQEAGEAVAKKAAEKGTGVLGKTIGKLSGKALAKSIVKKIPFVGAGFGLFLGVKRMMQGDWLGGFMEVGSGLASLIPGVGTAASVGIDVLIAGRDIKKELEKEGQKGRDVSAVGQGTGGFVGMDFHPITGKRLTEEQKRYRERLGHVRWMNIQEQIHGTPKHGYGGMGVYSSPTMIGDRNKPEFKISIPLTDPELSVFASNFDPKRARSELSGRLEVMQNEAKQELKERKNREEIAKLTPTAPAMPAIVPIETGDTGLVKDKSATAIDSKLDKFLSSILADCSFEFGNRYKRYVYDSNVGFSFA